jgi:hypothetical protein
MIFRLFSSLSPSEDFSSDIWDSEIWLLPPFGVCHVGIPVAVALPVDCCVSRFFLALKAAIEDRKASSSTSAHLSAK